MQGAACTGLVAGGLPSSRPATAGTALAGSSRLHSVESGEEDFSEPEHRRCHNRHRECPMIYNY